MRSSLANWIVGDLGKWTDAAERAIRHGDRLRVVYMDGATEEARILAAYDSGQEHIVNCQICRGGEPTVLHMRLEMQERALVGVAFVHGPDGHLNSIPALARSIVTH